MPAAVPLSETRRPIRALAPLLVNQIAAGEVIERPASVLKELVENALDAGASRVRIDLERGGIELVRVADDGCGIPPEELPLALAPHATSKIAEADDLDRIATMGFRGEALASIASVSRLTLRSRTRESAGAHEIGGEGERVGAVRPAAGPPGTTVEVRNLFFNTPARRKFLRTPQTEQQRCLEWVRDLAMAHPAVAFEVACDGRRAVDLPPGQTPRERAVAILGEELEGQLVECSADGFDDARGLLLWGLVGLPTIARATPKHQHVFLNGRTIRDRTVQHALREAYRGLVEPGRHPTGVLMLEMSPAAVDVNVHPAKLEVRFRDQSMVHQAVLRAVRDALRRADLTPGVSGVGQGVGQGMRGGWGGVGGGVGWGGAPGFGPGRVEQGAKEAAGADAAAFAEFMRSRQGGGGDQGRMDWRPASAPATRWGADAEPGRGGAADPAPAHRGSAGAHEQALPVARRADRVLQVHNAYLVTQDDSGVVIIDQHALHERVMFEQLLRRVLGAEGEGPRPLESQALLAPVPVPAAPAQVALLEELEPLLRRIGLEAAPLGPRTIGVRAFPSFLFGRGVDPVEFVTELLEKAEREGFAPDSEEAVRDVLDMMACKAAVKAGDRLSEDELAELLAMRERVERSSNCPHGRPTTVRLSLRELERLFGRS